MPLPDMSDILTDPDFLTFDIPGTRQIQTIGNNGRATNAAQAFTFDGVVTSDKGDVLERSAIGERIDGAILIVTDYILLDGRTGISADLVTVKGRQYTVKQVNDYSEYGQGFVQAYCEPIPLDGGALQPGTQDAC